MDNKLAFLKKFNLGMSVLHAVQAAAVVLLSKEFLLPVTGTYLSLDESTQKLVPMTEELFSVSLPLLITLFLLLSSGFHLLIATVKFKQYADGLKNGINKLRWFEYSISASVMMLAISMLVGIYDLFALISIFALVAIMNLLGYLMELHNQSTKKTNWVSYWLGCLAGIVPWFGVAFTMWLGAANGSKAPTFVYWIFVSIFAFFNCFAINMVLQYKKVGKWSDYLYGEKTYIVLSLVAKSLLAWQVFAGTLRP